MLGGIGMASGCLYRLETTRFVTSLQELGRGTAITGCCVVVGVTHAGRLDISGVLVSLRVFRKVGERGACLSRYQVKKRTRVP